MDLQHFWSFTLYHDVNTLDISTWEPVGND